MENLKKKKKCTNELYKIEIGVENKLWLPRGNARGKRRGKDWKLGTDINTLLYVK